MTTIQTTQAVRSIQTGEAAVAGVDDTTGGTLLPEPVPVGMGGDAMTALAALITRADQQDGATARKLEDLADSAAAAQDDQRAAQLMDKANQDASQGLATGIFDIAGGIATGVGGALPDKGASEQDLTTKAVAQGLGKVLPGIGTIDASTFRAAGDRDDARAAGFEAAAQRDLRRYDAAHGAEQAADASVQKVAQFLQSLQQTDSGSRSAAASMLKG